jgi:hypothetical protein
VRREIMRRLPQAGLRIGTPRREVRLVGAADMVAGNTPATASLGR